MLRLTLLLLFCALVYAQTKTTYKIEEAETLFEDFISQFNKEYENDEEKQRRLEIFRESLKESNRLNELNPHAVFGINILSDISKEELLGLNLSSRVQEESYCKKVSDADIKTNTAPKEFDWRSKNVVTEVKNQQYCGSCYGFSTIGNIEGQYAIKYNKLVDLSVQQLVDCSKRNDGCNGGLMTAAMSDIIDSKGLETERQYPYKANQGTCQYDASKALLQLKGCQQYSLTDEEKLKEVLYHTGPLAIAIDGEDAKNCNGGIITSCNFRALNHGVVLVGYGTENGVDYWIIKNSWGKFVGEEGYYRLARNKNCNGIMNDSTASAIVA